MEPEFVCFQKQLSNTDVSRNLEIPNRAPFLPAGHGVMLVTDREGNIYDFVASVRADGRRSLKRDWCFFAEKKHLRAGEFIRIYWSGNGNQYRVQAGLELHGYIVWETL
ncbi:unnamed protein product [Ilex paraguariensis]|uniref:TF-B3 domain-containing protein n=1 Tax=Ilex paraguariensis TaxID=185542 RepID=A0ABC8S533_9AQUA